LEPASEHQLPSSGFLELLAAIVEDGLGVEVDSLGKDWLVNSNLLLPLHPHLEHHQPILSREET
jgi:hypothetical protein